MLTVWKKCQVDIFINDRKDVHRYSNIIYKKDPRKYYREAAHVARLGDRDQQYGLLKLK